MTTNDFNPALREDVAVGPCIGLLELCSVARGIEVADAILWEAGIEMLFSSPVQPGKYVMLFTVPGTTNWEMGRSIRSKSGGSTWNRSTVNRSPRKRVQMRANWT